MNRYLRDTLLAEAHEARLTIEAEEQRTPMWVGTPNLRRLSGWCAIGTAELVRRLNLKGIHSEIHMWTHPRSSVSHVFPVVEDHILDITASQYDLFESQPVVLIHHREIDEKKHYFWQSCEIFATPEDLIRAQKKSGWPSSQTARKKLIAKV